MSNRVKVKEDVQGLLERLGFRTIEDALRAVQQASPHFIDDPLALLHKRQLAKLLGVSPWTVDYWRKRGMIPEPILLSPQIAAWRRRDIAAWLAQREAAPIATRKPNRRRRTK